MTDITAFPVAVPWLPQPRSPRAGGGGGRKTNSRQICIHRKAERDVNLTADQACRQEGRRTGREEIAKSTDWLDIR